LFAKAEILQVELSTMCNALCLNCHRTYGKDCDQVNPLIPNKVTVESNVFDNLLSSDTMSDIKEIEFCGTIDDPLMHPRFLDIVDTIYKYKPNISITLHTNGSLRTEPFFKDLAISLKRFEHHQINWSIDGASQETNSMYRQKTEFDKILRNAKAFIDAGGKSVWQFLIFPWNEHEVEDAKRISEEYNFRRFDARDDRSGQETWWINGKEWSKNKKQDDILEIHNKEKFENEVKDKLKKHEIKKIQKEFEEVIKENKPVVKKKNIDELPISCMAVKRKQWFISWDSRIWPCCFLSNGFFMQRNREHMQKRLYENYGEDFNDLTQHSVDNILTHEFFTKDLEASFANRFGEGKCDKIRRCAETCAQKEK